MANDADELRIHRGTRDVHVRPFEGVGVAACCNQSQKAVRSLLVEPTFLVAVGEELR